MKKKILLNWISCAMIFGWTSKSYAYDFVVLGAKAVAALTGASLAAGAIYQYWSTQADERDYPAPGKMVDVGGYKLHINCTGKAEEGQPTVILDAGLGGYSLDWAQVQPEVAKFAHVCSYDRAGLGWSDESPNPRTSKYIAQELHDLLVNAAEAGPFILVGHSFGGINVRVFANKYPEEVAGVVLVDASHEDQESKLPKSPAQSFISRLPRSLLDYPQVATFGAAVGVARVIALRESYEVYPIGIRNSCRAKTSTTKFIRTLSRESENFEKSQALLKEVDSSLGYKPLSVITAGKSHLRDGMSNEWAEWCQKETIAWRLLQEDLATKSTNSRHLFAEKSGHGIPYQQPEIIIAEIKRLLNSTADESGF